MLSAATLSFFLALGSSLVAAGPLSNRANITVGRGCGTNPTPEFMAQAEAHFSKNKVNSDAGAAVASIPVYCTLDSLAFLSPW